MGPADAAVTVVIPTHDRLDLLPEAVSSVLDQEGAEVRVLVVDDGSCDGTEAWLRSHPDPRVSHIRLDPARERTAARNAGLAAVTTPYVLFLDDDDLLAPRALARLVRGLERHPSAPVAAGTYATFGTYGPEELPRQQPNGRFPIRRRMFREILWGWYLLPGAGLWRADFLRGIGGWDESRDFAEDLELSLRIHPHPMSLVPHVVLRYRQHGRSVDEETQAGWEVMNAAVRQAFLDRLSGSDQRSARRVIDARSVFARALTAYDVGDYRTAAAALAAGMRGVPGLVASPVLGPVLAGMLAKSVAARLAPERLRRSIRDVRRGARARRYGARAT